MSVVDAADRFARAAAARDEAHARRMAAAHSEDQYRALLAVAVDLLREQEERHPGDPTVRWAVDLAVAELTGSVETSPAAASPRPS